MKTILFAFLVATIITQSAAFNDYDFDSDHLEACTSRLSDTLVIIARRFRSNLIEKNENLIELGERCHGLTLLKRIRCDIEVTTERAIALSEILELKRNLIARNLDALDDYHSCLNTREQNPTTVGASETST